jgi:hypothetical protein
MPDHIRTVVGDPWVAASTVAAAGVAVVPTRSGDPVVVLAVDAAAADAEAAVDGAKIARARIDRIRS